MLDSKCHRVQCVILGDSKVGKSCVVGRFVSSGAEYSKNYNMTLGVELHQKTVQIPDSSEAVELLLVDCSGRSLYQQLLTQVITPSAAIIAYDVTNPASLNSVADWWKIAQQTAKPEPLVTGILLACKSDLTIRRKVTQKSGHELARRLGLVYMESSAKENLQVEEIFFYIANEIYKAAT